MKKVILIVSTAILFVATTGQSQSNALKPTTSEKTTVSNKPATISVVTMMDSNGDGLVSASEATGKIKAKFSKIDTNKNGLASEKEIRKYYKSNSGRREN